MTGIFYKLFTHDRRPPVQGGEPAWDGAYPCHLGPVPLDTGQAECSYGLNFASDLAAGFRIAGIWKMGRPNIVTVVEPGPDAIQRGDKYRASTLRLLRAATEGEIRAGIWSLSTPFGEHRQRMAEEQWLWREALGRPQRDRAAVEAGLEAALKARGLGWHLREFGTPADAWAAGAAGAAWAAWDALSVCYASLKSWVGFAPDRLTVGLRDAYRCGLEIALPTGPGELGWVMAGEARS